MDYWYEITQSVFNFLQVINFVCTIRAQEMQEKAKANGDSGLN